MARSDIFETRIKQIDQVAPETYSFGLKNDLSELEVLRQHVKKFTQIAGLSESCTFEIILCLDELFTNIVSYGFEDDRHHLIQFRLQMVEEELIINVEDGGLPFNPLDKKGSPIPVDPQNIKIGGLGIQIVKKLTDDICYQRNCGKNHLTLKKSIESNESPLAI